MGRKIVPTMGSNVRGKISCALGLTFERNTNGRGDALSSAIVWNKPLMHAT